MGLNPITPGNDFNRKKFQNSGAKSSPRFQPEFGARGGFSKAVEEHSSKKQEFGLEEAKDLLRLLGQKSNPSHHVGLI